MRQFFSESYSRVCVEANREQLEMRWKGIEEYFKREEFDVYELVKMFYCLPVSDEFSQDFFSVFHNIDISFNRNNTKELSVLAGSMLYNLMEIDEIKLNTVLSIICLSKYYIDVALPEIIEKAFKSFGVLALNTREHEMDYKIISTKSLKDYAIAVKDLTELGQVQITGLANSINNIASSIEDLVKKQLEMKNAIEVYHEDSNILAWLFGNWSNDLDIALTKEVAQKDVALILAKELADLVVVIPGPYPVKSFLNKMLDLCEPDKKTYSLVEMVDSLKCEMKQRILEDYNCIDDIFEITPILYSIKSALEVDRPEVWQYTVSKHMGFEINSIHNSVFDWALLMYLECMLVKTVECE